MFKDSSAIGCVIRQKQSQAYIKHKLYEVELTRLFKQCWARRNKVEL